jgi:hypothetical protein
MIDIFMSIFKGRSLCFIQIILLPHVRCILKLPHVTDSGTKGGKGCSSPKAMELIGVEVLQFCPISFYVRARSPYGWFLKVWSSNQRNLGIPGSLLCAQIWYNELAAQCSGRTQNAVLQQPFQVILMHTSEWEPLTWVIMRSKDNCHW